MRYSNWADAGSPYWHRDPAMCLPTGNGDLVCPPPGAAGWPPPLDTSLAGSAIVGNIQTSAFYDSFGNQPSWAAPGVGDRPWTPYGRLIRPVRGQLAPLVYCGTYYNVHCVYT